MRPFNRFYLFCFALAVCTACAPTKDIQTFKIVPANELGLFNPTSDKAQANLSSTVYKMDIGDELEIKIQGHDDFNQTVKVKPDGMLTLPLIGEIKAKSRTTDELENEITQRYRLLATQGDTSFAAAAKEYLITVNDDLAVKFPYHTGMDQSVKVRPDGRISLKLIGSVRAEGKTPKLLNDEINRRYQLYLKNPSTTVIVNQFSTLRYRQANEAKIAGFENIKASVNLKASEPLEIFVGGNVLRPGVVRYRQTLTALTAIIEAGGGVVGAELSNVVLLRENLGKPIAAMLDLSAEFLPERASQDVVLKPHDIIIVPNTKIDQAGDFMEDLVRVIPPIQNGSFAFFYGL